MRILICKLQDIKWAVLISVNSRGAIQNSWYHPCKDVKIYKFMSAVEPCGLDEINNCTIYM
jgi:hypothetical protein